MNFNIGDRVELLVDCPDDNHNLHIGDTGTIVNIAYPFVDVAWDKNVHGHTCSGRCEFGYGWCVALDDICVISDEAEVASFVDLEVLL